MKNLIVSSLAAAALAAGALASPSFAQTQSDQQNQPGTGGTSKPGVQGLPGSKSGPTVTSPNAMPATPTQRAAIPPGSKEPAAGDQTGNAVKQQDESKVPGLPGGKSGPAIIKQ